MPLRSKSLLFCVLLLLPFGALSAQEFTPLFNGKDLTGWDGNPELWSVEDGVITGKTNGPDHLPHNQFLIWKGGEVKNFELRATVRVTGTNNSGIQYRSKAMPEVGKWVVGGYQCDMHGNPPFNAMIYEERGRGIVVKNGQSVVTDPEGRKWLVAERDPVSVDLAQWHEYRIVAKGNHLKHFIDGKLTIELADYDEAKRSLSGLLAFQVHRGPAMKVQIKDVKLKKLPDGGVTPFEKADVPSDAQEIAKPKPRVVAQAKKPVMPQAKPAPAKAAPKPKPRPKRQTEVGPQIGENKATPIDRIKVRDGFKVELLYSVPGGEQGSWVALCNDDKGRIYASDQYGDLYRFTPPAKGKTLSAKDVDKVPVNIRAINGMVFAFGALYAGVNDYEQKMQSGLYRITDTNGDDQLDKVEMLRGIDAKSDHGVHAVMPTPDGKALYLVTGNNAILTETPDSSPVPKIWGDDHLLPRMPDGRGHNRHVLAPGGIIYRVSPDGKEFKIHASGFRNIYGASVNKDGELFTYDADMEYDFNTPWYRPTRVNHVVSGGEFGWRNGAGKYPEFYPDNLPAAINIGPGSPTGTRFGYGAKFPAKYQNAYYILDWSWGKVYAVHLQEDGASYTATKEEFITGAPLPVTDAIIHPKDGAMYFAIGGRRVQSGLYRVTYHGKESTAPVDLTPKITPMRKLRHQLEAYHGKQDLAAILPAFDHLDHEDRFIAWAARTALEHQPVEQWYGFALSETNPSRQIPALLALARVTGVSPSQRPEEGHVVDVAMRANLFSSLLNIDWKALNERDQIAYVRTIQIVLNRFGDPDKETINQLIAKLDPVFPAKTFELNWLLCETLVHLQAPNTAAKGMALIADAESQEPQMEYARSLRHLKTGWTPKLREQQLEWFLKAANYRGGASFGKFIEFIRTDGLATFTAAEKKQHAELIAKKAEPKSAIENLGALFAGRTPKMWTLDELSKAAQTGMVGRDFANGRKMFSAAACLACHRFGNAGGMTGPDLTGSGGRYSPHDLLDQIINPSKEINEQFAPIVVTMNDGSSVSGVVVNLSGDRVTLNTDVSDPNQRVNVDRKEVKHLEVSKVSPMPPMLLSMLKEDEILDLLAYALSGGDPENEMFAPAPKAAKPAAKPKPKQASADWKVSPNWLKLPKGLQHLGGSHGDVAVSENGDVYISLTSGLRAGVQVYDKNGKYLRNLPDAPRDFHGFVIHKDKDGVEYIYGPQLGAGKIVKMTLDGKVVLTIPGDSIPKEHWKVHPKTKKPVLRMTACDVAPNGDIFVTDGYSTDLIHKFNPKGEYQETFGGKTEPYKFSTLHKIAVDTRFDPVRIVGVSRADGRVVHLSTEGKFLGNVATDLLMPAALVVQGDYLAVGEIKGRVTILDKSGKIYKQLGHNTNASEVGTNKTAPDKWRPGIVNAPHGVAFNAAGDLFVTEYSTFGRIIKYARN